jgi:hypothetical protein
MLAYGVNPPNEGRGRVFTRKVDHSTGANRRKFYQVATGDTASYGHGCFECEKAFSGRTWRDKCANSSR